jgi:hypothetical protein
MNLYIYGIVDINAIGHTCKWIASMNYNIDEIKL